MLKATSDLISRKKKWKRGNKSILDMHALDLAKLAVVKVYTILTVFWKYQFVWAYLSNLMTVIQQRFSLITNQRILLLAMTYQQSELWPNVLYLSHIVIISFEWYSVCTNHVKLKLVVSCMHRLCRTCHACCNNRSIKSHSGEVSSLRARIIRNR